MWLPSNWIPYFEVPTTLIQVPVADPSTGEKFTKLHGSRDLRAVKADWFCACACVYIYIACSGNYLWFCRTSWSSGWWRRISCLKSGPRILHTTGSTWHSMLNGLNHAKTGGKPILCSYGVMTRSTTNKGTRLWLSLWVLSWMIASHPCTRCSPFSLTSSNLDSNVQHRRILLQAYLWLLHSELGCGYFKCL